MAYRPPRNVFLLSLTSFFNDFSSEMVLSAFPAFFVSVLHAGAGALGFTEGLAEGASNIIKIYSGRLSDATKRRKPLIIAGYALSVATRPVYLLVGSVAGVAGLRFTDRIGKGLRDSPRDAILSLSTPEAEMGRAFGFHRAFDTAGAIMGPLAAYLILSAYPGGFHVIFSSAFFIGIAAVLSLLFITEVAGEAKKKNISLGALAAHSRDFKRYLLSMFLLSLGSLPVAVLLLKTQNIGLALATIPLFYMLYNISYAVFSYPAGKASDRVGPRNVLLLGYLLLAAGYVFIAYANETPLLIFGFLVLGLFPAMTDGVARTLASRLSPEDARGGALGLLNATIGFGLLFSGVGGGYLWQAYGANYAFVAAGAFVFLGVLFLSSVSTKDPA